VDELASNSGQAETNPRLLLCLCCMCRFQPEWSHVISGVEEAVYGWVALNYLHGKLALPGHHQRLGAGVGATSNRAGSTAAAAVTAGSAVEVAGRTLGALDLGGSTMEVGRWWVMEA
jgi:hypothetical protein